MFLEKNFQGEHVIKSENTSSVALWAGDHSTEGTLGVFSVVMSPFCLLCPAFFDIIHSSTPLEKPHIEVHVNSE